MKLVLLDRDGVINVDRPHGVTSKEDFSLIPGVGSAIKRLNQADIPVAIVTNQACVGRGDLTKEGLEEIHTYLRELLEQHEAFIDQIFACTSQDSTDFYRKPNPGLLLQAFSAFNVSPSEAVIIGDDLRDLEAGVKANCERILVRTGKGEKNIEKLPKSVYPVRIYADLLEATEVLIGESL